MLNDGCDDFLFGVHCVEEGDRISPLQSYGQAVYSYYIMSIFKHNLSKYKYNLSETVYCRKQIVNSKQNQPSFKMHSGLYVLQHEGSRQLSSC